MERLDVLMPKLTKLIRFALYLTFAICIYFVLKGKDFYSFKIKYKDGALTEYVNINIDDGTYNIMHFAEDLNGKVLFNEKIYGIHFYLSRNKHLFVPIKIKIYQGEESGLSFESMGAFVTAVIRDFQNASVLFINDRGLANTNDQIYMLSNLFLGEKSPYKNNALLGINNKYPPT